MRVLTYGLQSSGASLFQYCLSQRECLAVIDVHLPFPIDRFADVPANMDIFAKVTVSPLLPLSVHKTLFRPDITIFFRRDIQAVRNSLGSKYYRDIGGLLEDKLATAEGLDPDDFDMAIDYTDFLYDREGTMKKLGDLAAPGFYDGNRTFDDIIRHACTHSKWCRENLDTKWGQGNARWPMELTNAA